jgi:hypothetical protein
MWGSQWKMSSQEVKMVNPMSIWVREDDCQLVERITKQISEEGEGKSVIVGNKTKQGDGMRKG